MSLAGAQVGSLMAPAAAKAAAHLLATGVRAPEVLDVGAGTAPWSLALARRAPLALISAQRPRHSHGTIDSALP